MSTSRHSRPPEQAEDSWVAMQHGMGGYLSVPDHRLGLTSTAPGGVEYKVAELRNVPSAFSPSMEGLDIKPILSVSTSPHVVSGWMHLKSLLDESWGRIENISSFGYACDDIRETMYERCMEHYRSTPYGCDLMQMEGRCEAGDTTVNPQFDDHNMAELVAGFSYPTPSRNPQIDDQECLWGFGDVGSQWEMQSREPAQGQISKPGDNFNEPSLLGSLLQTLGGWGRRGQRGCRTRIRKTHRNRNNPHWSSDEVRMLVKGVETYGPGKWTAIKEAYFQTSIRTAEHLKDKWKNVKAGCGPEVKSKRKVKPREATRLVLQSLEAKIIEIETRHAATTRSASTR